MARRYDSSTTTFSPDGRLCQVEYAMEAINNCGSTIGIMAKDAVILAGEKRTTSKLLDQGKSAEKIYKIDDHVICAVAGIPADANILIQKLRVQAQRYTFQYREQMPIEQLITTICDVKQGYTQYGGLRPFGVSFLFAGYDAFHGYQLYHTDPSGNYSGWKATAIGLNNSTGNTILRQDWEEDLALDDALKLVAKVLVKTMDTASPTAEKVEFAVLDLDENGAPRYKLLADSKVNELLSSVKVEDEEAS